LPEASALKEAATTLPAKVVTGSLVSPPHATSEQASVMGVRT
jgi:hypothetical protein